MRERYCRHETRAIRNAPDLCVSVTLRGRWRIIRAGTKMVGVIATIVAAAALQCGAAHASEQALGPPTAALAWRAMLAHRLPRLNPETAPAVLVLDAHEHGGRCRIKVRLPSRPNTAATWIDADRVRLR